MDPVPQQVSHDVPFCLLLSYTYLLLLKPILFHETTSEITHFSTIFQPSLPWPAALALGCRSSRFGSAELPPVARGGAAICLEPGGAHPEEGDQIWIND